jgi:hypothetical protein
MTTVYTIHNTDPAKLATVKAEMATLGAPVIRVVNCGDYLMALEGTHRIAAAHALDLAPEFVVIEQDDELNITEFDWFDPANWAETTYPAGEVAGELFSSQAQMYRF